MGYTNRAFCGESKMPWQECNPMGERLKFIARLLDGYRPISRPAAALFRISAIRRSPMA